MNHLPEVSRLGSHCENHLSSTLLPGGSETFFRGTQALVDFTSSSSGRFYLLYLFTFFQLFIWSVSVIAKEADPHTSCSVVISTFDEKNYAQIGGIAHYIRNDLKRQDMAYAERRLPSILNSMSNEGFENTVATVISYCRDNPRLSLQVASKSLYEDLRSSYRSMGIIRR